MMTSPIKTVLGTITAVIAGFIISVVLPYGNLESHGSGPYLNMKDPLVLKGQDVYKDEGCFYCHTKNLRPLAWEMDRFANAEKLGHFPMTSAMEYRFESPSTAGSRRVGPDLSRIASKMTEEELRNYLNQGKTNSANPAESYHAYQYLFKQDMGFLDGVSLNWKIRAMLQAGAPFNEPMHRYSHTAVMEKSRGDALIAYLKSLGGSQTQFAGTYYQ